MSRYPLPAALIYTTVLLASVAGSPSLWAQEMDITATERHISAASAADEHV